MHKNEMYINIIDHVNSPYPFGDVDKWINHRVGLISEARIRVFLLAGQSTGWKKSQSTGWKISLESQPGSHWGITLIVFSMTSITGLTEYQFQGKLKI